MENRVRRPSYCAGAIAYDDALRERRIKCPNETGDPLVRLCAGCRVIEKLEEKRRRQAMFGDDELPSSRSRYQGSRFETRSTELEDSAEAPRWPTRRSGNG